MASPGRVHTKGLRAALSQMETKFYQGKFYTFCFFFHYELPKIQGLLKRLEECDGMTVSMDKSFFSD